MHGAVAVHGGAGAPAAETHDVERLGISQATVSKIEHGKAPVDPDLVRRWLAATGNTGDDLIDELIPLIASSTELTDWRILHADGWQADADQECIRTTCPVQGRAGQANIFRSAYGGLPLPGPDVRIGRPSTRRVDTRSTQVNRKERAIHPLGPGDNPPRGAPATNAGAR